MTAVDASVRIARSREDVFDFITRPENWPSFRPSMLMCEPVPAPPGERPRVRGVTRVGGRSVAWLAEVVAQERPSRYAVRSVSSPVPFELEWTLTDDGEGGCVLEFHQEAPDRQGLLARIADRLVAPRYAADLRENHEHLKGLVEST